MCLLLQVARDFLRIGRQCAAAAAVKLSVRDVDPDGSRAADDAERARSAAGGGRWAHGFR